MKQELQNYQQKSQEDIYLIKGKLQEKDEEMNKVKKDAKDNESLLANLRERISSLEKELKAEKISGYLLLIPKDGKTVNDNVFIELSHSRIGKV